MRRNAVLLAAALTSAGCAPAKATMTQSQTAPSPADDAKIRAALDGISNRYVKLVLALGEQDADYVDAYYGPEEWREEAKSARRPLAALRSEGATALAELAPIAAREEANGLRKVYLAHQLSALLARVDILSGRKMSFDEESKALYDAVAPHHDEKYFEETLAELDRQVPPGPGTLGERLAAFRKQFIIPTDKLDAVFEEAIAATRDRTRAHIALPEGESFVIEYVKDKPWGGYNWYKGGYRSVIQINTDLPTYIDRALDLAGHEGYPGHHVYNVLLEKNLVKGRGWTEFTVYPLFSPQSLIAEGSANYGVDVVFPKEERAAWEKQHLFPIAGLDAAQADRYYRVLELTSKLDYATNEAARRYLDGHASGAEATSWLSKYTLMPADRAQQRLRFIDKYRSYVINYNLGKDLVKAHVEVQGGTAADPERRWRLFEELLSSPRLPSGLRSRG